MVSVGLVVVACSSGGGSASQEASAYCDASFSALGACGILDLGNASCESAIVQICAQSLATVYSSAGLSALAACPMPTDCSCYQASGCTQAATTWSECVARQIATVPASSALQKVATDFCKTCPDGASKSNPLSCSTFLPADGGVGAAAALALLGDTALDSIDTSCTGSALLAADAAPPACVGAFMSDGG